MEERTGDTADFVDIFHDIFATGFDVGEEGDAIGYRLEIIQREGQTDGASHGDEV